MKAVQGFTLMEVLVAMFVLAIGILGAGALQMVGFQGHQGSYYRTQAIFVAGDLVDRMRTNPTAVRDVISDVYNGIDTDDDATIPADPGCKVLVGGCTPSQLAEMDVNEWAQFFNPAAPLLPNGQATVRRIAGNDYQIIVSWDERVWQAGNRSVLSQSYQVDVAL